MPSIVDPTTVVMLLNALWFGVAFVYFSLTPVNAAKLLVPRSERNSPLFHTLTAAVRFLGGMNLALSILATLLLLNRSLFPETRQWAIFAFIFSIAHATQFVCNVPVAFASRREPGSLWPVMSGPMLFIFAIDFTLAIANGVLAFVLLRQ